MHTFVLLLATKVNAGSFPGALMLRMVPFIFAESPHNSTLTPWTESNAKTAEDVRIAWLIKHYCWFTGYIWLQQNIDEEIQFFLQHMIQACWKTIMCWHLLISCKIKQNVPTWGVEKGKSGAREVAARLYVLITGPESLRLCLPGDAEVQPVAFPHTAVHLRLELQQRKQPSLFCCGGLSKEIQPPVPPWKCYYIFWMQKQNKLPFNASMSAFIIEDSWWNVDTSHVWEVFPAEEWSWSAKWWKISDFCDSRTLIMR